MRGLEGKRVLVAGGGTGIGAATALRLAEEGAVVALSDADLQQATRAATEIFAAGGQACALHIDPADQASVEAGIGTAVARMGGLDGVVNVAADASRSSLDDDAALVDMDASIWDDMLRVNLTGYALIGKYCIPHLIAAGGGSIVNTTAAADHLGAPTRPAHAASKGAINALTRHIARAYGRHGVRANSVSPGVVLSDVALAATSEDMRQHLLDLSTLPRLGKPDDLAQTICFLLSDDADWITGQVFSVNGGAGLRDLPGEWSLTQRRSVSS